mmetsp:Transcript_24012/g.43045  ORF Transcript_24012/g.43045 Transcript_24012/m.43045 type:complete len:162 (+) Transcript_24012:40-525(+)
MMMAAQISSGTTNQLAGESIDPLASKKIDNMEKPAAGGGDAPPARRRTTARRSRAANSTLSNSLRADRRTGLAATRGRLSVSFSDTKGLSAAQIGDILSGGLDGDDEPEASMDDLLGVGRKGGSEGNNRSTSRRIGLKTIQSQRSVSFSVDPKDLEDSDEE